MASVAVWISIVFGTIIGLIAFMGGAAKLCSCLPGGNKMSYGFSNVWGPFLGCPGLPLRLFIGLGELACGLGLLVALWCDAFDVFDEGTSDVAKALIIVAGAGVFTTWLVAAFVHKYVDGMGKMMPPMVLSLVALVFLFIRVFGVEPETWGNQMLCTGLSVIFLVGAFITLIINRLMGKHESTVEEENKKLNEM
eukprot:CAMPEP_0168442236 /NCGR_PEP_ID=MMETSP0228-20121227/43904_1 /TAXON_ID=133427 /ORGANISM="Protoceratium reticulatum, Strain CCCM 535 (=CCMP 1889)" /LENGTH=193 /DNA_ID=CAMNT_0008456591 /DNA_START=81 /DNA_END=662 /DNA_ORIENTATION=-